MNITNPIKLQKLLNLYTQCPYCNDHLSFQNDLTDPDVTINKNIITFQIDLFQKIEINLENDNIIYLYLDSFSLNTSAINVEYFGINKKCNSCNNFSYTIQNVISVKNNIPFLKSYIDNIRCTCIIDDIKHIIVYSYSMEQTKLYCYGKSNSDILDKFVVPLLPLNFKNPQQVIDKIKKLIIFT